MSRRKRLRINLIPGGIEKKRKEFARDTFNKAVIAIGLFWIFVLIVNSFLSFQIRGFKKRLSSVEKERETLEPLLKEREYLLKWKDKFYDVFTSLDGILKEDLSWFSILKSLSNLVPAEVWFRKVSLKEKEGKRALEIEASVGYLNSDEDKLRKMNSFLEAAKKDKILSENFEAPVLEDVTKAKTQEKEAIDFKFNLALKKQN